MSPSLFLRLAPKTLLRRRRTDGSGTEVPLSEAISISSSDYCWFRLSNRATAAALQCNVSMFPMCVRETERESYRESAKTKHGELLLSASVCQKECRRLASQPHKQWPTTGLGNHSMD